MTLRPTDMLEIQSAIDAYERKFPGRAAPSAEVALAWRLGKREARRRLASWGEEKPASTRVEEPEPELEEQECSRLAWAWEQATLRWQIWTTPSEDDSEAAGLLPWVKSVLLVGWWGVVAVAVASVFFFGAFVGGLK
jgi:hypothetical protein